MPDAIRNANTHQKMRVECPTLDPFRLFAESLRFT